MEDFASCCVKGSAKDVTRIEIKWAMIDQNTCGVDMGEEGFAIAENQQYITFPFMWEVQLAQPGEPKQ